MNSLKICSGALTVSSDYQLNWTWNQLTDLSLGEQGLCGGLDENSAHGLTHLTFGPQWFVCRVTGRGL